MTRPSPALVFFGPLPPPLNGMSQVNFTITEELRQHTPVVVVNTQPRAKRGHVPYYAERIGIFILAIFRLIAHRICGAGTYYASVSAGWGLAMEAPLALVARLMGMRIFLHHHSYGYIDRPSRLMRLLLAFSSQSATHIMQGERMAHDFFAVYSYKGDILIAPNAVTEPPQQPVVTPNRPLTVGLVSNLTFSKGIREFVETLDAALRSGIDIRGVLAGPIDDENAGHFIREALSRLGDRLEWKGPVFDLEKESFFQDIDILLLPSHTEAYPLVLLEALVRGTPFVAWGRGCIPSFRDWDGAFVIDRDEDFAEAALPILARFHDTAGEWSDLNRLAKDCGLRQIRENENARRRLISRLVMQDS